MGIQIDIGRGRPFAWPPRSRDLNTLDFYLWGLLKNYSTPVETTDGLIERIIFHYNEALSHAISSVSDFYIFDKQF